MPLNERASVASDVLALLGHAHLEVAGRELLARLGRHPDRARRRAARSTQVIAPISRTRASPASSSGAAARRRASARTSREVVDEVELVLADGGQQSSCEPTTMPGLGRRPSRRRASPTASTAAVGPAVLHAARAARSEMTSLAKPGAREVLRARATAVLARARGTRRSSRLDDDRADGRLRAVSERRFCTVARSVASDASKMRLRRVRRAARIATAPGRSRDWNRSLLMLSDM